jgi:peroxiredoxin Q/BCP
VEIAMSEPTPMPCPGDTAPELAAATATGEHFDLADHLGSWVVIYFYPRANTPG